MKTSLRFGVLVGALAVSVTVGCGGKSPGALGGSDGTGASAGDAGTGDTDGSVASGNDGLDAGTVGSFTSSDAAPSGVAFECKPGTYSGEFTTMVGNDAGGLLSLFAALFSYNWKGTLSITLQGKVTNSGAGEIPLPTLAIAPGAKLSGMDSNGGRFTADLSGQLDCPSKTFTATMSNGMYVYTGDSGIGLEGTMSATYDGTTTPPTLTMGTLTASSPQVMGTGAVGTWTASLQ